MTPTAATISVNLIPKDEVKTRAGISASYLYQLIAEGAFPRPVKVRSASRWVSSEVDAWIASRIAERDSQPAA